MAIYDVRVEARKRTLRRRNGCVYESVTNRAVSPTIRANDFDGNLVAGPALARTAAAQRVTGRQQMWTVSSKTSREAVATTLTSTLSPGSGGHKGRARAGGLSI